MEGAAKTKSHSLKSALFQWETVIFAIFIIINIINIGLSSNYLNFNNMMNNMVVFMDKALVVFTTTMVLLLGEIDISIAPIICLSGRCTDIAFEAGLPVVPAMMVGLLMGAAYGFSNGILLVALPDLNSTIVTLDNQILFRGVAYMILEDKPITSISPKVSFLTWSKVARIPLILVVFFVETLIFAFMIQRAKFGRSLYAIKSSAKASRFSGIKTNQVKVLVFALSGLCAEFAGLFLISELGSARTSITKGYEVKIIAMAILGKVGTAGEKGRVLDAVLGVSSVGLLRYGLGIVDVSSQALMIITGALLVVAVAIPNLKGVISKSASGRWIRRRVIHNKQKCQRGKEIMKKHTLSLVLAAAMVLESLAGCSTGQKEESRETTAATEVVKAGEDAATAATQGAGTQPENRKEKVYTFVSKTATDPIFLLMFDGYEAACDKLGMEAVCRGTDQPTTEKEIEITTQLIAQNVDAITVIGADFNALQPTLQRAMSQGIAVNSMDTAVNPDSRQIRVERCNIDKVGRTQVQPALTICGGPDSSGKIGIFSADPRSQLHADWCKAMLLEVEEHPEDYESIEVLDIAYGSDLPDKFTSEARTMLQNGPDLRTIISLITVGMLAAAKIIQDQGSDCKVTGVGLPSKMASYVENGTCYNAYLWNPLDQRALGAYSAHALATGATTGKVGNIVDAGDLGKFTVEEYYNEGTRVLLGEPLRLDKDNIAQQKGKF